MADWALKINQALLAKWGWRFITEKEEYHCCKLWIDREGVDYETCSKGESRGGGVWVGHVKSMPR